MDYFDCLFLNSFLLVCHCELYRVLCLCLLSVREFLGQGWMKVDKTERTPFIMKTSQHFNDVGLLCVVLIKHMSPHLRYHQIHTLTLFVLFCFVDEQPGGIPDHDPHWCGLQGQFHREVGRCGWHLPLSQQLQRHPGGHICPQSQRHLPSEEDLGQSQQTGEVNVRSCLRIIKRVFRRKRFLMTIEKWEKLFYLFDLF